MLCTFAARDLALISLTRLGEAYSLFRPSAQLAQSSPHATIDPRQFWARRYLSWRYIRGSGIEIGALHQPLPLYGNAKAKYVDRMSRSQLRKHYPELTDIDIVEPDLIDDGESLRSVAPESQDFIIANHFIEHCEDPIGTIETQLAKLKSGGVLFLAVPMKEFTFDKDRALTEIEHLVRDHEDGPGVSREQHYLEWARFVQRVDESEVEREAKRLQTEGYSIHFHVWNGESFEQFLNYLKGEMEFGFSLCAVGRWKYNPYEAVFVLRKT